MRGGSVPSAVTHFSGPDDASASLAHPLQRSAGDPVSAFTLAARERYIRGRGMTAASPALFCATAALPAARPARRG